MVSLIEMHIKGVSTRKVADITEKLCGINFSKSQVSDLSRELDGEIAFLCSLNPFIYAGLEFREDLFK